MSQSTDPALPPDLGADDGPPPLDPPRSPGASPTARRNWGVLLVGIGVLMLLDRVVPSLVPLLWTAVMLGAGGLFVSMWRRDPDVWWPLIPGLALLALGAGRLLDLIGLDRVSGALSGSLLFIGLGAAFIVVYLRDQEHWWAVIPAGAMLGLAGSALFGSLGMGALAGASLFIGLAAAFLWLLAVEREGWAVFPAGVMAVLALVVLGQAAGMAVPRGFRQVGESFWPVMLIVVGAWLLFRRDQAR